MRISFVMFFLYRTQITAQEYICTLKESILLLVKSICTLKESIWLLIKVICTLKEFILLLVKAK
jgi:hypothetical protein